MKRSLILAIVFACCLLWRSAFASASVPMCAQLNGEQLLIASNDGQGTEMCYRFQRCMANMLYTFSYVGYREVSRTTSSVANVATGSGVTILNSS